MMQTECNTLMNEVARKDSECNSLIASIKVLMTTGKKEFSSVGMGNFENVLCSDEPKKIECFSNIKALQVATGDNFALVLVLPLRPQNDVAANQKDFLQKVRFDGRDLLKTQVWSFGSINKGT